MSAWLEDMIKAAADAAAKGDGGGTSIGNADNQQGKEANAGSVNGIAKGIKGIVEAAGKAGGENGNALKDVEAAGDGNANAEAGKLFKTNGGGLGDAAAVEKAAAAVSAVSGKQIIKAIVDAAGEENQVGAQADAATNPIAAAIGATGDNGAAGFNAMQNNGKIAAAIVLRGLAKDGKFASDNNAKKESVNSVVGEMSAWLEDMIKAAADAIKAAADGDGLIGNADNQQGKEANAESVNGIAKGIKGIVDAAGKAGGENGNALKGVLDANDGDNAEAGKLFKTTGGALAAGDVAKAAAAVSAVSGKADNKSDC
ncbi:variable large family protein [Borreliella valaisiana]|uniref:variable large family protein n=1 Tax=Borreliella valaisiana TaxID=62088 RepID=UPI003F6A3801